MSFRNGQLLPDAGRLLSITARAARNGYEVHDLMYPPPVDSSGSSLTARLGMLGIMSRLQPSNVPGKHEFTVPGVYVTDAWSAALAYATPTRLAFSQGAIRSMRPQPPTQFGGKMEP